MTEKRFTITKGFDEHERQIRDNGKIIMGGFIQPQAEPIAKLLNELHEENQRLIDKLNNTALELVDAVISQGKAVEISEMSYHEFIKYRAKNGKPMELQL